VGGHPLPPQLLVLLDAAPHTADDKISQVNSLHYQTWPHNLVPKGGEGGNSGLQKGDKIIDILSVNTA
jgi:hypothetical protein